MTRRIPSDLPAVASLGAMTRGDAPRAPRPPLWQTVPCRNSHCVHRGTVHPEPFHTAADGTRFDRMP